MTKKTLRQRLLEREQKSEAKTFGRPIGQSDRPVGSRWMGVPMRKVDVLNAARRSLKSDGTIDKEKFANECLGWPGGAAGGYLQLRQIAFMHGQESTTESKGHGKGRREKRRR